MVELAQLPGGPAGGEAGAIAQLLTALAAFVGVLSWAVLKVIERKEAKKNGNLHGNAALVSEIVSLNSRFGEFQGIIAERTKTHSEAIELIRAELASRPWHRQATDAATAIGESELRVMGRLDRLEARLDDLPRKKR